MSETQTTSKHTPEAVAAKWFPDRKGGMYTPEAARSRCAAAIRESGQPDLLAACKLAQTWLANSIPTTQIDGPSPLPVLAAAIAKATPKD